MGNVIKIVVIWLNRVGSSSVLFYEWGFTVFIVILSITYLEIVFSPDFSLLSHLVVVYGNISFFFLVNEKWETLDCIPGYLSQTSCDWVLIAFDIYVSVTDFSIHIETQQWVFKINHMEIVWKCFGFCFLILFLLIFTFYLDSGFNFI